MKINKDEYIKQCWIYINTTLKYLKDISGNLYTASRKADFKDVSDKLVGLGALEALDDLKEGEYYSILKHSDEEFLGRYMGLYTTEDSYRLEFEVISATDTRIFYRQVTDLFSVFATDLNEYIKFEHKVLGDDDWPLLAGSPFKGKLLEKLLKESTNEKDTDK